MYSLFRKSQRSAALDERVCSKSTCWDFPGSPVLWIPPSDAGDTGAVPGPGTKILHALGQLACLNKRSHTLQIRLDSAKSKFINSLIILNSAGMCLLAQSCPTLCDPVDCSPPGSSVHGNSPDKNARVDCHALLQGIFATLGLNPGLPHYKRILHHLSHQGNPYVAIN